VSAAAPAGSDFHDDIIYPNTIAFVLVHLACLAAVWTGVSWTSVAVALALYLVRMFAVTAGYHRYFSHRSYKTSRPIQFVLAFLAQSSTQKSVLWWAALHRHHHRHSDTEDDVHSPVMRGFLYSHVLWIFDKKHDAADIEAVPDLAKFPELMFLARFEQLPAILLAVALFLIGGWELLVVGFFWSTVLLYHGTFFINSLAHVHGNKRYVTGDDSRNNWWLAIITLGEGWHNNHHAYQRSCRQGFRWYEFDPTFYALKAMSWMGLVWDLGKPPVEVVRNERPLGRAVIEKVARQLAASFQTELEHMKARLPQLPAMPHLPSLPHMPTMPHLPTMHALPSMEQLRARALEMYAHSPSMDEICARAREHLEAMMGERALST
jgi:stearoyl-CoA desaturase (Delta-9 desaturase)